MPIRPERRRLYPPPAVWRRIRAQILARAGNCCEGSPAFPGCRAPNGEPHPVTGSRVVLTIAHLNHRPWENQPGNLAALCNRCHLFHDRWLHAENRRLRRAEAAEERGAPSLSLPLETEA